MAQQNDNTGDMPSATYEAFILALSIFSLSNIVLLLLPIAQDLKYVVLIIDTFTSVLFLGDFFFRLNRSPNKRAYLVKGHGWLDLIGSLPFPLLRIARIFRVFRASDWLGRYGFRGLWREARAERAAASLYMVTLVVLVVLQYVSMAELIVEAQSPKANIVNASDAVWWAIVTVTTVGYGDQYPVTNPGRVVGVVLLIVGVGLFSVVTGFLANAFQRRTRPPEFAPPESARATQDLAADMAEIKQLLYNLQARVDALGATGSEAPKN